MSAKGSRRSAGISLTTAQRTAEISAACYDELPQRDSSAAAEIDVNQPLEALRAAVSEKHAHKIGPFRDFQTSTLPSVPPARDDLSSLSCVSFSNIEVYKPRLRQGRFSVSQNMAINPNEALEAWHRPAAQRRASIAAKARNERKPSGSRAYARLSHEQLEISDRRNLARDDDPTGRTAGPNCLILRATPTHRRSPKPSAKTERLARRCACLSYYSAEDRRREMLTMLCSLLC